MSTLIHIADLVLNRPLLCLEAKVEVILGVLGGRIGIDEIAAPLPYSSRFAGRKSDNGSYRITESGIAVVPIVGTLVNRGAYIGAESGVVSYEGITEQLKRAQKDPNVRGIVLDMDTPGGEAAGCFEIPVLIQQIRKTKPVIAAVNDMAASAGYAIASACNEIYVSQTSIVGSIGVVLVHFDRSAEMEKAGIKPTIIHAGSRKADGNPFGALPKAVKDRLQAEVENLRDIFIATVVAGRPKLKAADIKGTEAGCYMGQEAVAIGLADGVASFDKVLEKMGGNLTGARSPPPGFPTQTTSSAAKDRPMTTESTTPVPAMTGHSDQAMIAARSEARREGETAERARIAAILNLDEAKDRTLLAHQIALTPGLSVDDAKRLLVAQAATPAAASKTTALYEAVAKTGGDPRVQLVEGNGNTASPADSNIARQAAYFKQQRAG